MNETHELPDGEMFGNHYLHGRECICRPEVVSRWRNLALIETVVRHRAYTPAGAASTHLARGY